MVDDRFDFIPPSSTSRAIHDRLLPPSKRRVERSPGVAPTAERHWPDPHYIDGNRRVLVGCREDDLGGQSATTLAKGLLDGFVKKIVLRIKANAAGDLSERVCRQAAESASFEVHVGQVWSAPLVFFPPRQRVRPVFSLIAAANTLCQMEVWQASFDSTSAGSRPLPRRPPQ